MTSEDVLQKIHRHSLAMLQALDEVCAKYGIVFYVAYGALIGTVRHRGFIPWDNDIDVMISRENFQKLVRHRDEFPEDYPLVLPTEHGEKRYLDSVPRMMYRHMLIKMDPDACRYYNDHNDRLGLDFFFLDKTYDDWRGKLQRTELALIYGLLNAYRHKSFFADYSAKMKCVNVILRAVGRCLPYNWLLARAEKVATRFDERADAEYCFDSNDDLTCLFRLMPVKAFGKPVRAAFEDITAPIPSDADTVLRAYYGDYRKLPPEEERLPHWGRNLLAAEDFIFTEPVAAE